MPGPQLRLVLLLECTAAMPGYWPELRAFYIEPLLKALDAGQLGRFELALVAYQTRSPYRCGRDTSRTTQPPGRH